MSRDELLEMARLAGCGWAENGTNPILLGEKQLERFAALVAAHEREECAAAEAEVERLRAENALLRRVHRAAETLYQEAEEYDFDDGMGQGALQDYWDALADAFDAMEEDKEE